MRTLRAYFLGLQLREKLLLVAFALLIVAIWGSNFNRRAWQFKRAVSSATLDLSIQQKWLDSQESIEANVKKTADGLVATRTLDASGLLATVSSLAKEAGVPLVTLGESRSESSGQFNVHTREFRITGADYAAFTKFYLALESRSPYIGIEHFTQLPAPGNPALVTVSLTLSAPEVVRR
ncbi:MAG: hypothetical protein ABIZ81_14505 [Opitutaceae bacterium]